MKRGPRSVEGRGLSVEFEVLDVEFGVLSVEQRGFRGREAGLRNGNNGFNPSTLRQAQGGEQGRTTGSGRASNIQHSTFNIQLPSERKRDIKPQRRGGRGKRCE